MAVSPLQEKEAMKRGPEGERAGKGRKQPGRRSRGRRPAPPTPKQLRRQVMQRLAGQLGISPALATHVLDGILSREEALERQALLDYRKAHEEESELDRAFAERSLLRLGIYGHEIVEGVIEKMEPYDIVFVDAGGRRRGMPKTSIKFFSSAEIEAKQLERLIKEDRKVRSWGLGPIIPKGARNHIKNKTLFPLMRNREVVFFTTLEGDVIRGIIEAFSRYEIRVRMKGGVPIVLMRHAIYDARDKTGKVCHLKRKAPSKGIVSDGEDSD